jgi:DNA-binding GntR family transcriptional regulator
VRITLCRRAIETMNLPADPALVKELTAVHAAHGAAIAERRLRDVRLHNDRFHDLIFGACGNPYLVADIERYNRLSDPIRSTGISRPDWLACAVKEHAAMIDAIESGDRESLSKLVVNHMLPVRDTWLAARQLLVFDEPSPMA